MNDGFFKVTTIWQPIQLDSVDITDGIFSITYLGGGRVQLLKTDTPPTQQDSGPTVLRHVDSEPAKYPLLSTEKLYAKTLQGTANIGIIPA